MSYVNRIILKNYRRFKDFSFEPNEKVNIIIGDNESGKSSIIEAIDLVTSGNPKSVDSIGIYNLMNQEAISDFLNGEKTFNSLPKIIVELYLTDNDGEFDHTLNGKNNTLKVISDGIRLICEPNDDFLDEIESVLSEKVDYIPFEFYKIRFSTFADEGYSQYKKILKSLLIDSSSIGSDYATKEYIKKMYYKYTDLDIKERTIHKNAFQKAKIEFCKDNFLSLNSRIPPEKHRKFGFKQEVTNDFENNLMIFENGIGINNRGMGKQVLIKTDFALTKAGSDLNILLIEEPENHLSSVGLRELINKIISSTNQQLFITTHNNFACMRLELKNSVLLHCNNTEKPVKLTDLSDETSKYFMKTPPAGILDFVLSKKIIMVEGPAEFMLMDRFYKNVSGHSLEDDNILLLDARGLSFKRYLEVSKLLKNKVAIITDNDHDYKTNIENKYIDFLAETNIGIFSDKNNDRNTFEVCLSQDNSTLCKELFGDDYCDYMLKNKTDCAYTLAKLENDIVIPEYIKEAIEWIKH